MLKLKQPVVRQIGSYKRGSIGFIIAIKKDKSRYQVEWIDFPKTWVKAASIKALSTYKSKL